METMEAFAMGEANRGKELMVFDWIKAAKWIKEKGLANVAAGLRSDWEWTGGNILEDGKIPDDSYTYLASTWAVPEIEFDGNVESCFIMQSESPGWDSKTFWPKEAREICGFDKED